MKRHRHIALGLLLLLMAVPGCRGTQTAQEPPAATDVAFPVLAEESRGGFQALISGKLLIQGRCLLLGAVSPLYADYPKTLPVWPYGSSFVADPGGGAILDADGEVVARVGEELVGGGGEVPYEHLGRGVVGEIPKDCGEPVVYAVIGEFVTEQPGER